jgi:hypothetical protein
MRRKYKIWIASRVNDNKEIAGIILKEIFLR